MPKRNVQFLRLGEQHVMVGMGVGLARHGELRHPSALASGLHRPLQFRRGSLRIAQRQVRGGKQTSLTFEHQSSTARL